MEVKPHSALKHRILGVYFKICRTLINRLGGLHYVDLYAGDGSAECDEAPLKKWDVPFIESLLKNAEREHLNLSCYLNDIDPECYEKLKKKVEPYAKYVKRIEKKDANVVYAEFLDQIPPNKWSIWFLDPCKHSELDFKTIECISNHRADIGGGNSRSPELIINLLTYSMQRSLTNKEDINRALGIDDSSEWETRIEKGEKTYEVFLDILLRQLEKLGYHSVYFSIEQTRPLRAHLYYLIFASSMPGAYEILNQKFDPYIKSIMKDKWIKENFYFRMQTKAKKQGMRLLTDEWD